MSPAGEERGRLWRWLDRRIGLADLEYLARKKQVPIHRHTLWYYFGGMTLFLFAIQVATGILLLFYYRPSAEEAYESVQFLMAEVEFGWLIRSIHAWAANLMIFTLFVHLFSVLLLGAYRAPREVTWFSGVALMGLAMAFGFTGYLLPWNELAYFATKVGTEITGAIPVGGSFLRRLLRGGDEVTGATLTRFYGIHVAVLPALTTALVGLHLFLVQKHGMSVPLDVERAGGPARTMPFMPNFLLRDMVGWLAALAGLAALAAFFPAELGRKADPFLPAPIGIKPEWYFMFTFQTLKYLPARILGIDGEVVGVLGFGLAGLFLLLIPVLDRRAARGERSRLFFWIAVAIIVYMLVLTWLGYTASATAAEPPADASRGRETFAAKACARCHVPRGQPGVGPALEQLRRPQGAFVLAGRLWNHAPGMFTALKVSDVQWPEISAAEMGDLMSYLEADPARDPAPDPAKGQLMVLRKGCLKCHSLRGEGGRLAPDLSARRPWYDSAVAWATRMWRHTPAMAAKAMEIGVLYPRFAEDEMSNLVAYLRSSAR